MALITIDPKDLPNDALLDALRACEIKAKELGRQHRSDGNRAVFGNDGHITSGMALIAEAWRRGLISAPAKETGDE